MARFRYQLAERYSCFHWKRWKGAAVLVHSLRRPGLQPFARLDWNRVPAERIRNCLGRLSRWACCKPLAEWRMGWKRRGWKKADGEPPVNLDVIQRLDGLLDRHDVCFTWVPGHTGEPGNELADQHCNHAIDAVLAGEPTAWSERHPQPPFEIQKHIP